jgi:hypothetical protein
MQAVALRSSGMEQKRRDPLIGSFFIVRDADGRPSKAGRINSINEAGDYVVRVWFNADGSPTYSGVIEPVFVRGWLLYTNEASWRTAFASMNK